MLDVPIPPPVVTLPSGAETPSTLGSLSACSAGSKRTMQLATKKTNTIVREQYSVDSGSYADGGAFSCVHCQQKTYNWKKWNVAKARSHLVKTG
jgi:hypothetical protein